MQPDVRAPDTIARRVFAPWSVALPVSFAETFVEEDDYWHAWGTDRSLSLSGFAVTDERGPVAAESIVRQMTPPDGTPVEVVPPGLLGWAVQTDADPPARASRILSGMLAADGRALLVTITSDDLEWARRTWLSIRCHAVDRTERHA